MKSLLLLLALCALSLPGWCAYPLADNADSELIGGADVIAVGTVTDLTPMQETIPLLANQATIKIERVIKGPPLETAIVRYPGAGYVVSGPTLKKGQRSLFFLQRGAGGFAFVLTQAAFGVLPADNADAIAQLVKDFPVEITLLPPVGPYYFDALVPTAVKIKNTSTAPIIVYSAWMESYYFAPSLYRPNGASPLYTVEYPTKATPEQTPIPPGGDITLSMPVNANPSDAWGKMPRELYAQTLIGARARVMLMFSVTDGKVHHTYTWQGIASPWTTTTVGYPPPKEQVLGASVAR